MYNRELTGLSVGPYKNAELVHCAYASVKYNLNDLQMFHTDRGNEFKNKFIDQTVDAFGIKRSLSEKGTPYDNTVAEAAF